MNRIIGSANVPAGTDRMRCQLIKRTLHIEVSGRAQSRHRSNVRNGSIVLKKSVGGPVGRISSESRKLALSNISDLAWRPTPTIRSESSKFAFVGVFQHNRPKADIHA